MGRVISRNGAADSGGRDLLKVKTSSLSGPPSHRFTLIYLEIRLDHPYILIALPLYVLFKLGFQELL